MNSGWWQLKYSFIFTPKLGEDEPILTHIFSKGLVQPPTSEYIHFKENKQVENFFDDQ